jgi:hypothetical protein
MRLVVVIALFLLLPLAVSAQSEKRKGRVTKQNPSSLDPGTESHTEDLNVRLKKNRKKGSVVETEDEYVARMKHTVKEIRKKEKKMAKPQYSDPMYFGHKRPPKKNKAGHLKFCKECGMRH